MPRNNTGARSAGSVIAAIPDFLTATRGADFAKRPQFCIPGWPIPNPAL